MFGLPFAFAKNNKLKAGAALGGLMGGAIGNFTSKPLKSKEQLEKESAALKSVPKWLIDFTKELHKITNNERLDLLKRCKDRFKDEGLDSLSEIGLENLAGFANLTIITDTKDIYQGSEDSLVLVGYAYNGTAGDSSFYLLDIEIVYNPETNKVLLIDRHNKGKYLTLLETTTAKELAKGISKYIYQNSYLNLTVPQAISDVWGSTRDCEIPVEWIEYYIDEYNKSRENLIKIKILNNWR